MSADVGRESATGRVTRSRGVWDRTGVREDEVAECYGAHADELVRFAASLVGSSDADDVVSAAVLGVLRARTGHVDDLGAYLYRSVVNAARKHWRTLDRRSRREAIRFDEAVEPADPRPEIAAALARLSPQQRAVVHLTYWEDLTPAMVAERLDVGEGTVRRQLARARSKLSVALVEHGAADDRRDLRDRPGDRVHHRAVHTNDTATGVTDGG
jgi:RNA polymerase sigma-70 factor (ECF subfamily)